MANPIYSVINNTLSNPGKNTLNTNQGTLDSDLDDILFRNQYVKYYQDKVFNAFAKTDCTKVTLDLLFSPIGGADAQAKAGLYYKFFTDKPLLTKALDWLKGALTPEPRGTIKGIFSFICRKTILLLTLLSGTLDGLAKAVLFLFKKIDQIIAFLQKAISDFLNVLANCLNKIISDTKNAINNIFNNLTDFSALKDLFVPECPCIDTIIANLFCCQYAEGHCGNDPRNTTRLTTPDSIVKCVRDKFLDLTNIGELQDLINRQFDKATAYIYKALDFVIRKIQEMVNDIMTFLNGLMQEYCKFINKKRDVTELVNFLGPADCLLIWTTEYDKRGNKFKGMSIIDMIDTMKLWKTCLRKLCGGFTAMVDAKLKKYSKTYRTGFSYWNDILTVDYYLSCNKFDVDETVARAQYVIQKEQSPETPKRLLENVKTIDVPIITEDNESTNPQILGAVFGDSPSNDDFSLSQGLQKFFPNVERNIMAWASSLETALGDDGIEESITEMLVFETSYDKSRENILLMQKIQQSSLTSASNPVGQGQGSISNAVSQQNQQQQGIEAGILFASSRNYEYEILKTVNEVEVNKILTSEAPKRGDNIAKWMYLWYNNMALT